MKSGRSISNVLAACVLALVGPAGSAADQTNVPVPLRDELNPRGDIRIIHTADGHPWFETVDLRDPRPDDLCRYIDVLARYQVDMYSPMMFQNGCAEFTSKYATRIDKKSVGAVGKALAPIFEMGIEPVAVVTKRCHEHGIKILAGFRMNDRHRPRTAARFGDFIMKNQDLWIRHPGITTCGLDYAHKEVRDYMFNIAEEVITNFDLDGLRMCYVRYHHTFNPDQARENQPLLTGFMKRVRQMMDREGEQKGRRLVLLVQVPQTLQECHDLGIDVPAWISEGLIDYLCPMDYGSTDFNAPYGEFAELTKDSGCCFFPTVHSMQARFYHPRNLMSVPAYYAAARNFYAQGADGISTFNFMYHWSGVRGMSYPGPPEMYPKAFEYLQPLRDCGGLWDADRHYMYLPFQEFAMPGIKDRSAAKIRLERTEGARGSFLFRMAETLERGEKALLRLRAVGVVDDDRIQIALNGEVVPQRSLARTYFPEGRTRLEEGCKLPPYTQFDISLDKTMVRWIENTLELRLLESAPGAAGDITVPEIEVAVSAGGTDLAGIMAMVHEKKLPAMPVLAGYHPHHLSVWKERQSSWGFGDLATENGKAGRSKMAQGFVLAKKSLVKSADVFLYPSEGAEEAVLLSIRTDAGGVPGGELAAPEARARFDPIEKWASINRQLQGYYAFNFEKPLSLDPGRYWMVLEKEPADPAKKRSYFAHAASGVYPEGAILLWKPDTGWKNIGRSTFFGVHGEAE